MTRDNGLEDLAMYSNVKFRLVRILHVDDEPTDLEITRIFLRKAAKDNFEIVSVLSAEEALDKLENEQFDVVISDYKMPGMDGLQLLEAIRKDKDYGQIPFILFTGKGGDSVAAEALGKGGDKYITKSGDPASQCTELVRVIYELLHLELESKARGNRDKRAFGVKITEHPFHL